MHGPIKAAKHEPAYRIGYQPALDGLRTIAVAIVFASHTIQLFGGFLGVDIFFVLSGFLITTILLEDRRQSIDLNEFYKRRLLRILPALIVVSAFAYVVAKHFASARPACEVWAPLLWVSNVIHAFGSVDCPEYMAHTWSIAVEEQFYLAWPLILIAVSRFGGARSVGISALVLAAVVASWRLYLSRSGALIGHLFYSFDTRCDGLLIGAALACFLPAYPGIKRLAAYVWPIAAGTMFLLVTLTTLHEPMFQWGMVVTSICTATLIAAVVGRQSALISRILGFTPVAFIGARSYGIYLWHMPIIFALAHTRYFSGWGFLAASVTLTLAAACVMYELVEKPALSLRYRPLGSLGIAAAITSVCAICTGCVLIIMLSPS